MLIEFTPRISGGFVHHVMNNHRVSELMEEVGLNKETAHNLVKAIIITSFTDYKIDINDSINKVRDHSTNTASLAGG